jgi:hypothetical protein
VLPATAGPGKPVIDSSLEFACDYYDSGEITAVGDQAAGCSVPLQ